MAILLNLVKSTHRSNVSKLSLIERTTCYLCRNTSSDELMFLFSNSTVNKESCILSTSEYSLCIDYSSSVLFFTLLSGRYYKNTFEL